MHKRGSDCIKHSTDLNLLINSIRLIDTKSTLQVEELTSKSQNLEAELEKTTKQLKTVTGIAQDEAEKCKSAKEVIKSLTAQVGYLYSFNFKMEVRFYE